jgi:hypothetical protein
MQCESLLLPPRPVDRVEIPVRSHLGVHAETSISDSANITGESVPLTYELFIGSKKAALRK